MSIWITVQICLNLFFLGLIFWLHRNRLAKEDRQNNYNLQNCRNQIAVLEDLSDQTKKQAQQLKELIYQAEAQCTHLDQERQQTLKTAHTLQDPITHDERIDIKRRFQYAAAAKMAIEGMTREEIARQIHLPENELDFIMKLHLNTSQAHLFPKQES